MRFTNAWTDSKPIDPAFTSTTAGIAAAIRKRHHIRRLANTSSQRLSWVNTRNRSRTRFLAL